MSKSNFYKTIDSVLERDFDVKETLSVLTHNRGIWWSWGSRNLVNIKDKGLLFTVSGMKHKGRVLVTLGWNDTYTFRLLTGQYNEVYKETDVYFDELVERIDEKIEKQAYYAF